MDVSIDEATGENKLKFTCNESVNHGGRSLNSLITRSVSFDLSLARNCNDLANGSRNTSSRSLARTISATKFLRLTCTTGSLIVLACNLLASITRLCNLITTYRTNMPMSNEINHGKAALKLTECLIIESLLSRRSVKQSNATSVQCLVTVNSCGILLCKNESTSSNSSTICSPSALRNFCCWRNVLISKKICSAEPMIYPKRKL